MTEGLHNSHYRPDIDGLRALAILPVLLFHATIPGFSGGYVGVDIFFVISGYLITSILAREITAGKFSVASFYERRLRRIFPALISVVLAVVLIAPFFLLPTELAPLGREAISALLFVANINFWRESGYFSPQAEMKPLLHTWSLGIEEQFYLFCPIAIFIIFKHAYNWRAHLIAGATLASFLACVLMTPLKPSASFYLLPTRAWELLAGSLLAVLVSQDFLSAASRPVIRSALATGGLAAVLLPVFIYDQGTEFPGYAAAVPVVGSALLIGFAPGTLAGRFLSLRAFVSIGQISYSLYLWHWPVMVFGRAAGWLSTPAGKIGLTLASLLLGYISMRLIETPTRNKRRVPPRILMPVAATSVAAVVLVAAIYPRLSLWEARLPPEVVALDKARHDISPKRETCHFSSGLPDPSRTCVLGGTTASVAVWGDSHGVELAQALSEHIPVRQITYSACAPAVGRKSPARRPDCQKHNDQTLQFLINSPEVRQVVMVAFYDFSPEGKDELLAKFSDTAKALKDSGKQVLIVGPTPYIGHNVDLPTYLAHGGKPSVAFDAGDIERFKGVMEQHAAALVLPTDAFCSIKECSLVYEGHSLLFDAHHPTMRAARVTARNVVRALDRIDQRLATHQ
jgi:Predicted acyltransferases